MQTTSIKQKLLPVPLTRNYCSTPSCMKGITQYTALTSLKSQEHWFPNVFSSNKMSKKYSYKTEAINWTYVFSDRWY